MKNFTDSNTGVQTSLGGLHIQNENEGWTVLENPSGETLSFRFGFHFFTDRQQMADHLQNEVQQVANSGDLAGHEGIQYPDDDTVMTVYYQFIDNISHRVLMAAKMVEKRPGIFYIAVTKSESMIDACGQLFDDARPVDIAQTGKRDTATEKKLAGHALRYMQGYSSGTPGGGGTSTNKSFSLFNDHSFAYSYSSVISMGSFGGSTSQDQGFGTWQAQKDGQSSYLVLYWNLGTQGIFPVEWGEPGIVFLDGERYLLDKL